MWVPLLQQGPLKNIFFSGKCSRVGGGATLCFRPKFPRKFHNSPNKSLILQISQFQHARAPCPQVGPPGVPGLSPVSSISIPTFWLRDWVNFKFFMTSWELYYSACGGRYFCYTKDHFENENSHDERFLTVWQTGD